VKTKDADTRTWQTHEVNGQMDGTHELSMTLNAENEVEGYIEAYRPSLTIRCAKHRPVVYVDTGGPFETVYGEYDKARVRVKFDESAASQLWQESTDSKAAFASSPERLVKQLSESTVFRFEFTPFQKRETVVTFDSSC